MQSWAENAPWSTSFSTIFDSVARLVDPPGGQTLFSAAYAIADLFQHVPWLLPELTRTYPALSDLPKFADQITRLDCPAIPKKGYTKYRILASLRRPTAGSPHDRPIRALVLTLASIQGRLQPRASEQSLAIDRCIESLAPAIGGLYRERQNAPDLEEGSPLLTLLSACPIADSVYDYANRLIEALGSRPEAHTSLEQRLRLDLKAALGEAPIRELRPGEPQVSPQNPQIELPEDETYPDPLITTVPLEPRPTSNEEPGGDYRPHISIVQTEGKSGEQLSFEDLLASAKAASRSQTISHGNDQLLDLHVDVLTEPEAKKLAPAITSEGLSAARLGNIEDATKFAIAALSLALGYDSQRSAYLLLSKSSNDGPYLSEGRDHVVSPALKPPDAFEPLTENMELFEPTTSSIRIPLPPQVAHLLSALKRFTLDWPTLRAWYPHVGSALSRLCNDLRLNAVTKGRLRRTCSARLYAYSADLPAVMHLTRDTFGKSIGPMYYPCFEESYLQKVYRGAIWSLWDCQISQDDITDEPRRIGSKAYVRQEFSKKIAHSIGAYFHRSMPKTLALSDIVKIHNVLMRHVAGMLMAVIGHRPTDSLFTLAMRDFDLNYCGAIVRDKAIDAAHSARLVALGSKVSDQIAWYLAHLQAVASSRLIPDETIDKIQTVIKGEDSLLFKLQPDGYANQMSIGEWKDQAPSIWKRVPTNWGRHYLPSIARSLNIEPVVLHIQEGHLESAGYPFSQDSPMEPLVFLRKMGKILDKVFHEQGWRVRRSLATTKWCDDITSLGPLRRWKASLEQHARDLREQRRTLVAHYRTKQHYIREEAENLVITQAQSIDRSLAALIAYRISELRFRRAPVVRSSPVPLTIIQDELEQKRVSVSTEAIFDLMRRLQHECESDAIKAICAHNTLARCLRWASRARRYSGFVPSFIFLRRAAEPTPFLIGHMQATRQIYWLRKYSRSLLNDPRFASDLDYRLGALVLAVIVFGGIDNHEDLNVLRSAESEVCGIPALQDAIVISLPEQTRQVALRQMAALCYSLLRCEHVAIETLAVHKMQAALSAIIPTKLAGSGPVLDKLLDTVKVSNRVERSGIANLALDPVEGCVALTHDRLLALLGNLSPADEILPRTISIVVSRTEPTKARSEYREILDVWPNKHSDIELPLTGSMIELTQRTNPSRKRRLYQELVAKSLNANASFLSRSLAEWLAWELISRRPNDNKFRKYGGIYAFFTEVGSRLVARAGEFPDDLDPSALAELYLDVASSAAPTNLARIVRGLRYYHEYLQCFFSAAPVSFRYIDIAVGRPTHDRDAIDNQIVLPREQAVIFDLLERSATGTAVLSASLATDRRVVKQIVLILMLVAATGARIGEVLGVRRRDVIQVGGNFYLIFRTSGYLETKTRSARRIVHLNQWMCEVGRSTLADWVNAEEAMGHLKSPTSLIFADLTNQPIGPSIIRKTWAACCEAINLHLRIHNNRHAAITALHVFLGLLIHLKDLESRSGREALAQELVLPWALERDSRQFGHARPRTGLQNYGHTPWVYSIKQQSFVAHKVDRNALAACLAVTVSAADNRLQNEEKDPIGHAVRGFIAVIEPKSNVALETAPVSIRIPSSGLRISSFILSCVEGVAEDHASLALGLVASEVEKIKYFSGLLTDHADIALINGVGNASEQGCATPRWYGPSRNLQSVWAEIESNSAAGPRWARLAENWYSYRRRSHHRLIKLPIEQADELQSLLAPWGYDCDIRAEKGYRGLARVLIGHPSCPNRNLSHVMSFVFAIAWVTCRTRAWLAENAISGRDTERSALFGGEA